MGSALDMGSALGMDADSLGVRRALAPIVSLGSVAGGVVDSIASGRASVSGGVSSAG